MSTPPGPPLPPFGTPPPHPPAYGAPRPDGSGRTVDRVLSWLLYAAQVLGTAVLGIMSIFSVFATDSCGSYTSGDEPAVCDSDYFGTVLVTYWIALIVLLVVTLIALIIATATKHVLWPWAVGGFLLTVVSTIVFIALITR